MKIPLFRATVVCNPPPRMGGRFRCGRHFPAGATVVEDLTQNEIDRLRSDVLAENVSSLDRKTNTVTTQKVEKSFFVVTEIQENGTREVADPAPVALPEDRLPSAMEFLSLLKDMGARMSQLEAQNQALRAAQSAQLTIPEPEPVAAPEPSNKKTK